MKNEMLLGPWVRRFLLEHLVAERNLSRNTQASYRDTLMLLLPFASNHAARAIDRMVVEDLTPSIIRQFLDHLERDRKCSGVTRNQRLATIRSLARFIGMHSPVHIAWSGEVRAMPFKKTAKAVIGYLEKPEMDALLAQPDRRTPLGNRDYALLLFLYNSGARADEAANLIVDNLQLGRQASVRLHGKGNKFRSCPLWPATATTLSRLVEGRGKRDPVFLNRVNLPLTRFGIHRLVTHYAELASRTVPSIETKRVSPHTIRHTTAVHLLRAGVDINTIRAWLGHVSLDTTHIYAEVDMEMKAKALARVDISGQQATVPQRSLPSLMAFLKAL
ncbi:tyrosine-type recombinase/integrase [Mesorhizobium amorphae]|uniref:Integrase family protein n=1 Tax=Mesorhizobium amorphae CCNWGS0123 TaxID=1082933 RepID=G6YHR6_9HYPH|nr:tyrosine-type recombinase/integrase [Mesorhizobium amorphae]ANT54581.1 integrase [Mesorhizobium amorphae CCNWGS0123]ANT54884.1 integrase [Mesorhizobium amorphae CCNWGS0123]EHH07254.1 integrase family protein [Mesorhizobium amorphae CCNWGS0123]